MPWREVNSSPARRHNDPDVPPPKVSCNSSPCNERRTLSDVKDRRSPRLSTSSRSRADDSASLSARSVNARAGSIWRPKMIGVHVTSKMIEVAASRCLS